MITKPPLGYKTLQTLMNEVISKSPEKMADYLTYLCPVDKKGRYLPYDQFQYRVNSKLDTETAWNFTKDARNKASSSLFMLEVMRPLSYVSTPSIQRTLSETDRHTTTAALEWMSSQIGEESHLNYLLNDLIEDEAISSSQLEGAATTTIAAKDMLKRHRKPRTPDEKMILGNFKMMGFAWDKRNEPLSIELIREMHGVGTKGIDDVLYTPSKFRNTDDIAVVDRDGEVVHTPPPASELERRFNEIINWANQCHDDGKSREYVHPLIKAITLHFCIGYLHPFRDGNGRVARSLFYWFMFKSGYAAFRYIAISTLLKAAPVKYGKSYLYTETDNLDMTYFIEYQCEVILRAIDNFKNAYDKSLKDIEEFNLFLWKSGLLRKLNDKQSTVFSVARSGVAKHFTSNNVMENLGCSYNTASSVLNGLVELSLFSKEKSGREWVFTMRDKRDIQKGWK